MRHAANYCPPLRGRLLAGLAVVSFMGALPFPPAFCFEKDCFLPLFFLGLLSTLSPSESDPSDSEMLMDLRRLDMVTTGSSSELSLDMMPSSELSFVFAAAALAASSSSSSSGVIPDRLHQAQRFVRAIN